MYIYINLIKLSKSECIIKVRLIENSLSHKLVFKTYDDYLMAFNRFRMNNKILIKDSLTKRAFEYDENSKRYCGKL